MTSPLSDYFRRIRSASLALCETLEPEDCVVQTMPDVSPTKWHLAHTTWFFEHFVLGPHRPGYEAFHPAFGFLFNSYYHTVGQMHLRPRRGLLSRPTLAEVRAYRAHVDEHLLALIDAEVTPELDVLVTLGLHHEQQHQELMLTDIKHVFSVNPLEPALRDTPIPESPSAAALSFIDGPEGVHRIGHHGEAFCFDNETPRHATLLRPHALASRPVTNGEYREFIGDGGYRRNELWLSDGWSAVTDHEWDRPLYWNDDLESQFTLAGRHDIDPHAPVCHVSFYEADAYARWADARLPTEAESELALRAAEPVGNFVESGCLHPVGAEAAQTPAQLYGDVWEWTSSPYAAYPGFRPLAGSLGEYNGKFMCNQMVLRGGSCATPGDHIRATYRNFFYPDQRWQFSGIRLAKDR